MHAVRLSVVPQPAVGWAAPARVVALPYRPGLADALNALQRGDVLLVAKRDRIARDAVLSVLIERELAKKGARVISAAGEGTETDDPAAIFTRRILDAVSELERALIRSRVRVAMAAAKARGQRVGRIPFGQRLAEDGIHLEPDPEEQTILRQIHEWRRAGYVMGSIAQALNARGLRTRQGREWQRSFVSQLLDRHALRE